MSGRNYNYKKEAITNGPLKYWTDHIEPTIEENYMEDGGNNVENFNNNGIEHYNNCLDEEGKNVENFGIGEIGGGIGKGIGSFIGGIFEGIFGKWGHIIMILIACIIIYALVRMII